MVLSIERSAKKMGTVSFIGQSQDRYEGIIDVSRISNICKQEMSVEMVSMAAFMRLPLSLRGDVRCRLRGRGRGCCSECHFLFEC